MDFRHLIVTCLFSMLRLSFETQKIKKNYAILCYKFKSFCFVALFLGDLFLVSVSLVLCFTTQNYTFLFIHYAFLQEKTGNGLFS